MYGLEKNPKEFHFDLEDEMKKDPKKAQNTLKKIDTNISEIKKDLKSGKKEDKLGILLHGYSALQKVLKRIIKK